MVQIGRTKRPVAFPKEPKKRKKRQWQTGYLPRPPTSPYRSQSLHVGWPPVCSSIFKVLLKSVQWFCCCGWSKIALPHYFGHLLIQQLLYYRTSRDIVFTILVTCEHMNRQTDGRTDGCLNERMDSLKTSRNCLPVWPGGRIVYSFHMARVTRTTISGQVDK